MTSLSYLELFQKQCFWSVDLQNKEQYTLLIEKGYKWIRRDDTRRFDEITRRPTIGCYVEVFKFRRAGCVPIVSPQGHKLIHRVCYF